MDANTDPRDVLPVNRWTTKQEVRKQMWERQSWSTRYDLVTPTEDKLDQSLLFLTRDMGLDDALEPFRIFVSERALSLFNQVTWMGKEYVEASNEAKQATALMVVTRASSALCFNSASQQLPLRMLR